jgi:hypothetical protein
MNAGTVAIPNMWESISFIDSPFPPRPDYLQLTEVS